MTGKNNSEEKEKIISTLKNINKAWLNNETGNLEDYFHEQTIIFSPDFQKMGEGREVCINSYREFASNVKVEKYNEHDYVVEIIDDTALATYRFDITYEIKGEIKTETGRDLFIMKNSGKRWIAVYRILLQ